MTVFAFVGSEPHFTDLCEQEVWTTGAFAIWLPYDERWLYSLEVDGIDLLVWLGSFRGTRRGDYFTEVGEPILDSIRFLDQ